MFDRNINLDGWFETPGAYVLVDGQFGSTGKGLMAGFLAEYSAYNDCAPNVVTTNAGPNSGHTAYWDFWGAAKQDPALGEQGYAKIMTQQIPVASVFLERIGHKPLTYINAGAVVDPSILNYERKAYGMDHKRILVHPNAAVITARDIEEDQDTLNRIAGTGKGIGPAIANKVRRIGTTAFEVYRPMLPEGDREWDSFWDWEMDTVFVETAQGFSLGLNTAKFYPNVTSRECTVMQAIADARIPVHAVRKTVACFRTFPIRVGNTKGSSGGYYPDQQEVTWESLGLEPELTTVTKRVRRVFTWSRIQFRECIAANAPDVVFLNFCNYLSSAQVGNLVDSIREDYESIMGRLPKILLGYGPHSKDVVAP
jgi:adenylosuccinate synthase